MTTKTGEKLRGRKRDPSVLEKAWFTRRANKAKAKRSQSAARKALDQPNPLGAAYRDLVKAGVVKPNRGSKTPTPKAKIRKAKKARTSQAETARRSKVAALATQNMQEMLNDPRLDSVTTAMGASGADGANLTPIGQGLAVSARVALTIARKKGAAAEVEMTQLLHGVAHNARMEEQRGLLEATSRQRREHLRVVNQKIVCGFLAEVEMAMANGRGLPPGQVWTLNSFVITKIVDVLNNAGYTGKGFRDPV